MKIKSFAQFIQVNDQQWSDAKESLRKFGKVSSYQYGDKLQKAIKESDMKDEHKDTIGFFVVTVFMKILYELETEEENKEIF